jgi:hypothetical protein
MIILTYRQPVRLAAWADDAFAEVFTVRGYATVHGMNPEDYETMARANGHVLAGTIYSGGALVSDRATAKRLLDARRAAAAAAVTLAPGQVVEIDGRPYEVRVPQGNDRRYPVNSDPIHFKPVWKLDLEGIDDALRDDADRRAMEAQCFPNSREG